MATQKHTPDPNENAARIMAESTANSEPPQADLEAGWAKWSSRIQGVDERALTLLRAAFEAGWEGASKFSAAAMGRAGGLKGGKARAEKLSAAERSEIAKKAAKKRWSEG